MPASMLQIDPPILKTSSLSRVYAALIGDWP
jgi:hypothetical protein